ncbi:MAG: hypothetical protein VW146_03055 [Gammaproteobacteria bacterium]
MNQTNLIYFALAVCVGVTLMPWILSIDVFKAGYFLNGIIAIICSFLGGLSWSWKEANPVIGILISFLAILIILVPNIYVSFFIGTFLLNFVWWYERRCMGAYLEQNLKYKKSREIATYVLTICILISATLQINPY